MHEWKYKVRALRPGPQDDWIKELKTVLNAVIVWKCARRNSWHVGREDGRGRLLIKAIVPVLSGEQNCRQEAAEKDDKACLGKPFLWANFQHRYRCISIDLLSSYSVYASQWQPSYEVLLVIWQGSSGDDDSSSDSSSSSDEPAPAHPAETARTAARKARAKRAVAAAKRRANKPKPAGGTAFQLALYMGTGKPIEVRGGTPPPPGRRCTPS